MLALGCFVRQCEGGGCLPGSESSLCCGHVQALEEKEPLTPSRNMVDAHGPQFKRESQRPHQS